MDVHPTKDVSIGIDPYPYYGYFMDMGLPHGISYDYNLLYFLEWNFDGVLSVKDMEGCMYWGFYTPITDISRGTGIFKYV